LEIGEAIVLRAGGHTPQLELSGAKPIVTRERYMQCRSRDRGHRGWIAGTRWVTWFAPRQPRAARRVGGRV